MIVCEVSDNVWGKWVCSSWNIMCEVSNNVWGEWYCVR